MSDGSWEQSVDLALALINTKLDRLLASKPASAPASGSASETLPNYGKSKGQPIRGASIGDLEYYAAGCRRSLDDPSKSRWHATERERLAAIEAEIARQRGGTASSGGIDFGGGDGSDNDIPFAPVSGRVQ